MIEDSADLDGFEEMCGPVKDLSEFDFKELISGSISAPLN